MYLPEKLEHLREYLASISNINLGGCGIAALAMYRLAEMEGIKSSLVCLYDYDDEQYYKGNMRKILGEDKHGWLSVRHVVLKIGDYSLDTKTINFPIFAWPFRHIVSPEMMYSMLKTGGWNPTFNREFWLPRIEKHIGFKLLN